MREHSPDEQEIINISRSEFAALLRKAAGIEAELDRLIDQEIRCFHSANVPLHQPQQRQPSESSRPGE